MSEPIRIAQMLNRMDSGGIEAVVMNCYRHMDPSRIQFDFYFYEGSHFPRREELEKPGACAAPWFAWRDPKGIPIGEARVATGADASHAERMYAL